VKHGKTKARTRGGVSAGSGLRHASQFLAALMIASVLLLAGCGDPEQQSNQAPSPAPSQAPSSDASQAASVQLDKLIKQYADSRAADTERTELKDVSADFYLQEIESNRQLLEQVRAVDATQLALEERIDQRLLIGLLESEIYSAQKRRQWENDASLYVPAAQIGRLLEPQSVESPDQRAASLQALLEKIPERLAEAKKNLLDPPRRFTEAAIFKTQGTLDSLRKDAASLAGQTTIEENEFMR